MVIINLDCVLTDILGLSENSFDHCEFLETLTDNFHDEPFTIDDSFVTP